MRLSDKTRYLLWAIVHWPAADRACPGCGSRATSLVRRKYAVTELFRCRTCQLMFRVPKGSLVQDGEFYENGYTQGATTELPDEARLAELQADSFRAIGKDYSGYIAVLQAVGVLPGSSLYDFGSSWGYGSWQFSSAGYRVYSYDVAPTRARYAAEKLGCHSIPQPTAVPEAVDCMFASHVVEHLADPSVLWTIAAQVLKPRGVLVLLTPNGEPARAARDALQYHRLWGRVHPLLLTGSALGWMAERYGFAGSAYSSPYDLGQIGSGRPGDLDGEELLFVARRRAAPS